MSTLPITNWYVPAFRALPFLSTWAAASMMQEKESCRAWRAMVIKRRLAGGKDGWPIVLCTNTCHIIHIYAASTSLRLYAACGFVCFSLCLHIPPTISLSLLLCLSLSHTHTHTHTHTLTHSFSLSLSLSLSLTLSFPRAVDSADNGCSSFRSIPFSSVSPRKALMKEVPCATHHDDCLRLCVCVCVWFVLWMVLIVECLGFW